MRVGFAPQLTLEAAMAHRGAFGLAPGAQVAEAIYVKLFSRGGGRERPLVFTKPDAPLGDIAEKHSSNSPRCSISSAIRRPATRRGPIRNSPRATMPTITWRG